MPPPLQPLRSRWPWLRPLQPPRSPWCLLPPLQPPRSRWNNPPPPCLPLQPPEATTPVQPPPSRWPISVTSAEPVTAAINTIPYISMLLTGVGPPSRSGSDLTTPPRCGRGGRVTGGRSRVVDRCERRRPTYGEECNTGGYGLQW